jgi:predicted CXXCH cytochrome family protein
MTATPATETPTTPAVTATPATETPTTPAVTATPATETPTTSAVTGTPATETPTVASFTATVTLTETPLSTNTATPIAQPTTSVPPSDAATGEIVVKFGGLVPDFLAQSAIGLAGGEIQSQVDALGLTIVSAPEAQVSQVLASLQDSVLVEYAEPNYAVQSFYTPNDSGYVNQTYLADMQIPAAWDVTKGEGIIVAVIDTGVDISHPDLATNILVNPGEDGLDANGNSKRSNYIDDDGDGYVDNWMGWNFVNNNNDARDVNGHGSQTAGIIAAQMDNALGISGIAPRALVMPIKALDDTGFGTYSQVAQAIIYAVDHGAQVINLGFGGTANSGILLAATDYAYNHGVVVVAAGGNTGTQTLIYPAANPNVIGVSALDENLNVAAFSSYTSAVQISAPGVGIYSTAPGGNYASMSGTSMSAAQVSGVVALLITQPQFDTVDKVREALFNTALDLGVPGLDNYYGYGLAHAFDALNYIPGNPIATPTASPTPDGSVTPVPTTDPGGVIIMADMAGSTINSYAPTCSSATYNAGLVGGTSVPTLLTDDAVSASIPLGFDFWYMGTRYTKVYVSSNGWLSFNDPGADSLNTNGLDNSVNNAFNAAARPILAPLWDNLGGAGGAASYITDGTAPNRTFTFEWWNFQWNDGAASRISMRVVLHEGTGVIDFMYYPNDANVGVTASMGITGTANNSFISADNISACPTWSTATETTSLSVKPPLDTVYTFTPGLVTLVPPSNLNLTNVTNTSVTLNWTDNSTGEDGFGIYTSTDGVNYTYVGQVAAGVGTGTTLTYNATGNANNYWKVYAAVEGNASAAADVLAPSALNFTAVNSYSRILNWTDNSNTPNNESGFYIYRSTDNTNFTYVTKTAADATSYTTSGLTPGAMYYWRVQAVAADPTDISGSTAGATISAAATNSPPVVNISAPADGTSYARNAPITFAGTSTDTAYGDLTSSLVWYSDLSGPLTTSTGFATGGNVTVTSLLPGTHTITAQSINPSGDIGSDSVTTIMVSPLKGPHGNFDSTTDMCSSCHRSHSAGGAGYLTTDPNSVLTSDAFCLSCHNGTKATAVSTHSNKNWTPSTSSWKAEADFEIRCVQCHDSHGSSNLFAIRTDIKPNINSGTTISPMTFTSLTSSNSFDDGVNANRLCVSCHTATTNHPGGAAHLDGQSYVEQSCVACHPHTADFSTTTMDGFMPVRSTNP